MQLARGIFLSPARHIKRKLIEVAITFQLEHRYNKQQIFEMYANQIPLGQRGSFGIDGFGEAARPTSARMSASSTRRMRAARRHHPESQPPESLPPSGTRHRAPQRRSRRHGRNRRHHQSPGRSWASSPLHLAPGTIDSGQAPYFVDIVHDQLVRSMVKRVHPPGLPCLQLTRSAIPAGRPGSRRRRHEERRRTGGEAPREGQAARVRRRRCR